jgi:hypothetical protein
MSKTELKTKEQEIANGKELSSAVHFACEIESNFKLYSYRIIDTENFIQRTNELIRFLESQKQTLKIADHAD